MSDVELVIKIPEESYKALKSGIFIDFGERSGKTILQSFCRAIHNGTPLPKGHGDLVDVNTINLYEDEFYDGADYARAIGAINDASIIIEANKESEEQIKVDKEYEEAENAEWGTMEERGYIYDESSKTWVKKEN